ncbi:hypothetical protein B0H16DRAFT_1463205 [Mycena metata]|uniref:Uncharacterized protein n=1 Tax=Mycena metata TaxID=1033252 RepID=A0AAD7N3R6_9AGAR|nr:hypothetical protein B0H16DRAFT_1463205 [Mycena metata]
MRKRKSNERRVPPRWEMKEGTRREGWWEGSGVGDGAVARAGAARTDYACAEGRRKAGERQRKGVKNGWRSTRGHTVPKAGSWRGVATLNKYYGGRENAQSEQRRRRKTWIEVSAPGFEQGGQQKQARGPKRRGAAAGPDPLLCEKGRGWAATTTTSASPRLSGYKRGGGTVNTRSTCCRSFRVAADPGPLLCENGAQAERFCGAKSGLLAEKGATRKKVGMITCKEGLSRGKSKPGEPPGRRGSRRNEGGAGTCNCNKCKQKWLIWEPEPSRNCAQEHINQGAKSGPRVLVMYHIATYACTKMGSVCALVRSDRGTLYVPAAGRVVCTFLREKISVRSAEGKSKKTSAVVEFQYFEDSSMIARTYDAARGPGESEGRTPLLPCLSSVWRRRDVGAVGCGWGAGDIEGQSGMRRTPGWPSLRSGPT